MHNLHPIARLSQRFVHQICRRHLGGAVGACTGDFSMPSRSSCVFILILWGLPGPALFFSFPSLAVEAIHHQSHDWTTQIVISVRKWAASGCSYNKLLYLCGFLLLLNSFLHLYVSFYAVPTKGKLENSLKRGTKVFRIICIYFVKSDPLLIYF